MPQSHVQVQKASGEQVLFDAEKLRNSLLRAGANPLVADTVLLEIQEKLQPNTPSEMLYRWAFKLLKKYGNAPAARYRLKRGLMELGPSGYPFEQLVARLFAAEGLETRTGLVLKGQCVSHEVDVWARNQDIQRLTECKFHNLISSKSDVKVALYVNSRFLDLREALSDKPDYHGLRFEGWIVTNTRFTEDAERFALCRGLHLLSWDFPKGNSLRERIDRLGLYPLTCLNGLNKKEKAQLLSQNLVLAQDLMQEESLETLNLSPLRRKRLQSELAALCTCEKATDEI